MQVTLLKVTAQQFPAFFKVMVARTELMNIAAEIRNIIFLNPLKVTFPMQMLPKALRIQL